MLGRRVLGTVLGINALLASAVVADFPDFGKLENCVLVGPLTFRWALDGDKIEFQVEGAVGSSDTWLGIGFTEGSTVRMAVSDVVISGFLDSEPFSSSYALSQRSSSGVNTAGPNVELIFGSLGDDGIMRIRGVRELGSWPTDGSQAVVWATGPVDGPVEAPVIIYHGTSHAPGGTTGTIVLGMDQDSC